ncbi:unnamed protein product [Prorocentrum cordatum]|uniref:Uncharacterized protein n=1 Tax=Prorocentrum cordatum TaxID=2364126 RepID=A0ABN9YIN6_9DINO|nr:unnamed protein product [Polarella glacialis]
MACQQRAPLASPLVLEVRRPAHPLQFQRAVQVLARRIRAKRHICSSPSGGCPQPGGWARGCLGLVAVMPAPPRESFDALRGRAQLDMRGVDRLAAACAAGSGGAAGLEN